MHRAGRMAAHVIPAAALAPAASAGAGMAPAYVLNSGKLMPTLGLGTFQATEPGEVAAAVKAAVRAGYRLIDCAAGYGNQAEIGTALQELFAAGEVKREELFIVSKLFQTHHVWNGDTSRAEATLAQTLSELQLEYLDLFLIHWPFAFEQEKLESPPGTPQPLRLADGSPNPIWNIKMEYTATWAAMEEMVRQGKTKSIGVSNFTIEQLKHLASVAKIMPAVNQVELHPYIGQKELLDFCAGAGIRVMGYSPLGSSAGRFPEQHGCTLLKHPLITSLAERLGKSAGQVLIRWGLQRGAISIPKSSNPGRISQNFDVLEWELTPEQMAEISTLDSNFRYFISYMKKPDNNESWHDGKVETGTDADFI